MKKFVVQLAFSVFFVTMLVACLVPFPISSSCTNIRASHVQQINDFWESEIKNIHQENATLLGLKWKAISPLLSLEKKLCIYDIKSQTYFFIKRIGGKNHADVVPYSSDDEETISTLYNNEKCCHPVFVKLGETSFLPASFSSLRRGYQNHFCLHFLGSKTDGTSLPSRPHQNAVKQAQKSRLPQ